MPIKVNYTGAFLDATCSLEYVFILISLHICLIRVSLTFVLYTCRFQITSLSEMLVDYVTYHTNLSKHLKYFNITSHTTFK
jgi:hypothetical protein